MLDLLEDRQSLQRIVILIPTDMAVWCRRWRAATWRLTKWGDHTGIIQASNLFRVMAPQQLVRLDRLDRGAVVLQKALAFVTSIAVFGVHHLRPRHASYLSDPVPFLRACLVSWVTSGYVKGHGRCKEMMRQVKPLMGGAFCAAELSGGLWWHWQVGNHQPRYQRES